MPGVFISYRRDDCPGHAGRLFDRLRAQFGIASVFIDVAGIEPGVDFVEALERAVGSCDVLLAVIGRDWVASADRNGRRRLGEPHDFVRLEISSALRRGVRVVPVLVEGARMPTADVLPEDLAPLVRRQAVELRDTRWDADVDDLIRLLRQTVVAVTPPVSQRARVVSQSPRGPLTDLEIRPPVDTVAAPAAARQTGTTRRAASLAAALGAVIVIAVLAFDMLDRSSAGETTESRAVARTGVASTPASDPQDSVRPTVPNVVGKPVAEAERLVADAGLISERVRVIARDATPGTVVRQEPVAGTRFEPLPSEKSMRVRLGIAEAGDSSAANPPPAVRATTRVPNLVGQNLSRASATLRQSGLLVGSSESRATRGAVAFEIVSQDPSAGTSVPPGSRVNLVFAKPGRTLPDFTGDLIEDAIATLEALGFVVRTRQRSTDEGRPQRVLEQFPRGGTELEPGSVVEIVYATGKVDASPNGGAAPPPGPSVAGRSASPGPRRVVPAVDGLHIDEARVIAGRSGFALRTRPVVDRSRTPGTVFDQSPPPGTPEPPRDPGNPAPAPSVSVAYAIPEQVVVPDLRDATLTTARMRLARAGFVAPSLGLRLVTPGTHVPGTVVSQSEPAGTVLTGTRRSVVVQVAGTAHFVILYVSEAERSQAERLASWLGGTLFRNDGLPYAVEAQRLYFPSSLDGRLSYPPVASDAADRIARRIQEWYASTGLAGAVIRTPRPARGSIPSVTFHMPGAVAGR
jgi:beta-lactam-binding protein with PASTA domain